MDILLIKSRAKIFSISRRWGCDLSYGTDFPESMLKTGDHDGKSLCEQL
jgi:hypothetical protein